MTRIPAEQLRAVACRVLEEAAFVFAAPTTRQPEWPAQVVEVELDYAGPAAGILRLRATPRFGAEVAANLMGLEPGDPEADVQARSALAELLNIVAGAVLAEVFGTRAAPRLGIPTARVGPAAGALGDEVVVLRGDDSHPIEFAALTREARSAP